MNKQKLLKLSLLMLVLSLTALWPKFAAAATTSVTGGTNGPLCNSGGYFSPANVTVTSGDTVTFSVPANDPYAGGIEIDGFPQGSFVVPRGGSVTTQSITANVSYQGTWPNSPSCIKGSGSITVQSAPTPPPSSPPPSPPASSATTPKSNTTTSKTTAPSSSTAQPIAVPKTVVVDTISINGQKVTSLQNLKITQTQTLALSGTTVPNGKITLTIHSDPATANIQADSTGKWAYVLKGAQIGNHTIYATVTDPATNQTSTASKLLGFTVAGATLANTTNATSTKKNTSSLFVVFGLIILIIAAIVGFVLKQKSSHKAPITPQNLPAVPKIPQTNLPPQTTPPMSAPSAKSFDNEQHEKS